MQFGGVHVVPCGSLMWVEFRVGVMMRNENELESRNQIMEPALCRQKESELPSDRDGMPTEGYASGAMSSTLSFFEGRNHSCSSLQDALERGKTGDQEKN